MSGRETVEAFVGFDSAWTDNAKRPGAICSVTMAGSHVVKYDAPQSMGFKEAAEFIRKVANESDYTLIAIDQPTIVRNPSGCCPVERVAGSVINAIAGGVQCTNRGKVEMFGDVAPIWWLLDGLQARQNPTAAREARSGIFLIEVFPALALTALAPIIWDRRKAAKYNPANKLFTIEDWSLVAQTVEMAGERMGSKEIVVEAARMSELRRPRKENQDCLDSLICLVCALQWRKSSPIELAVIGDGLSAYMVTPATEDTRKVLSRAAVKHGVPMDDTWTDDAPHHRSALYGPDVPVTRTPAPIDNLHYTGGMLTELSTKQPLSPASVGVAGLRALLIHVASERRTITYGEIAERMDRPFTLGFRSSLKRALNLLAEHNDRLDEPFLMALVVNKRAGLPGIGYWHAIGAADLTSDAQAQRHRLDIEEIWQHAWS